MAWKRVAYSEEGAVLKDWGGRLPIALIYPNSYYIGMSDLGIHAIYKLLNDRSDIVCERAFWEKGEGSKPLLSLESGRPLTDFSLLAFSVTYELDYFNISQILKSAGIPVIARERGDGYPIIIAGGPCITANPMPLSPFFDALAIGEAEPILPKVVEVFRQSEGLSRTEILERLARLPGLYVPEFLSKPVIRQFAENLDEFPVATTVFSRKTEFGDMFLIEVQRGCNWGCRFCLVHNVFYPMRVRSLYTILTQAERGLKYRKRIGLVGPDVSDYPYLEELVMKLSGMDAGISVSSLRVKPFSRLVLRELVKSGAKTITLAPEVGTDRLCKVINKGIDREDVLEAVSYCAEEGVRQLKLYFMVGLPSETDEDVQGITQLVLACKDVLDKGQKGARLSINVSPFIPKAGTPFERLPMASLNALNERITSIKNTLMPAGIEVKSESPAWCEVQTVLSRGDASLAEVISDTSEISLASWRKAAIKNKLDIHFYAHKEWSNEQKLPWNFIDLSVRKQIV